MEAIAIMFIGVLVGSKFFPHKYKKANESLQMASILLLIFFMGLSLGSKEGFLDELLQLGLQSVIYALVPIACSVIVVQVLCKLMFGKTKETEKSE